jgi:hypothetical protein
MSRALLGRVRALEALHGVKACECMSRPRIAVQFEDTSQWDRPNTSISREEEAAKVRFACVTHGAIGPEVIVSIKSFNNYGDADAFRSHANHQANGIAAGGRFSA